MGTTTQRVVWECARGVTIAVAASAAAVACTSAARSPLLCQQALPYKSHTTGIEEKQEEQGTPVPARMPSAQPAPLLARCFAALLDGLLLLGLSSLALLAGLHFGGHTARVGGELPTQSAYHSAPQINIGFELCGLRRVVESLALL